MSLGVEVEVKNMLRYLKKYIFITILIISIPIIIQGCYLVTKLKVENMPIDFNDTRVELTKEYIKKHYNLSVDTIEIVPKIIVIHWTGLNSLRKSFKRFKPEKLPNDRGDISNASALNVSAHYLIDRDGTIYQLMPENLMARHTIGLNFNSIGIENVGGESGVANLTDAQLNSNIKLIKKLQNKYSTIEHIIGHYEYRNFENSPLWLEVDESYRTKKSDPSIEFMNKLRSALN